MKLTIKVKKEVDVQTLLVKAGVRYWEDATVNGVEDEDGSLIPCREGDYWCPIINIDSGLITNWAQGVTANIHYKVCDDGTYELKDTDWNTVAAIEDDYVPNIMCIDDKGYGDYIIMKVDETGQILNWHKKPPIKDFMKKADD